MGKTAKSILISCGARLAPFDIEELRELMSYDELELDTLGDRKTALFLIMSDTDDTFNFVIAILQSQLFNLLCDKADDEYNGKLPVHVRFLLDEFANIGQIPRFDKLIATIRSREMSASILLVVLLLAAVGGGAFYYAPACRRSGEQAASHDGQRVFRKGVYLDRRGIAHREQGRGCRFPAPRPCSFFVLAWTIRKPFLRV